MFGPFRRQTSIRTNLQQAQKVGLERAREMLPDAGILDAFLDLAARNGIDLTELAERATERFSDIATRAGESAGSVGRQAREVDTGEIARQMRSRAADLASRAGVEGLATAIAPPRKRRSRKPLALGLLAGVLIGGALAYFFVVRESSSDLPEHFEYRPQPQNETQPPVAEPEQSEQSNSDVANLRSLPSDAVEQVASPVQGVVDGLRHRWDLARQEAKETQQTVARELWREYDRDVRHLDEPAGA